MIMHLLTASVKLQPLIQKVDVFALCLLADSSCESLKASKIQRNLSQMRWVFDNVRILNVHKHGDEIERKSSRHTGETMS